MARVTGKPLKGVRNGSGQSFENSKEKSPLGKGGAGGILWQLIRIADFRSC